MRTRFFPLMLLAAIAAGACQQAETDTPDTIEIHRISGRMADEDTKTVLRGTSNMWLPGDKIRVFCNGETGLFTATTTKEAKTTDFEGSMTIPSGNPEIIAVYPCGDSEQQRPPRITDRGIMTSLSPEQIACEGTYGNNLFATAGCSHSLEIPFYSVTGCLRFCFSEAGITQVTVRGNNNEPIAGDYYILFDDNGVPETESPSFPNLQQGQIAEGWPFYEVNLYADGDSFTPGKNYLMVLLPTVFEQGITVTLKKPGYMATVVIDRSARVSRSVVSTVKEVAGALNWEEDESQATPVLTFLGDQAENPEVAHMNYYVYVPLTFADNQGKDHVSSSGEPDEYVYAPSSRPEKYLNEELCLRYHVDHLENLLPYLYLGNLQFDVILGDQDASDFSMQAVEFTASEDELTVWARVDGCAGNCDYPPSFVLRINAGNFGVVECRTQLYAFGYGSLEIYDKSAQIDQQSQGRFRNAVVGINKKDANAYKYGADGQSLLCEYPVTFATGNAANILPSCDYKLQRTSSLDFSDVLGVRLNGTLYESLDDGLLTALGLTWRLERVMNYTINGYYQSNYGSLSAQDVAPGVRVFFYPDGYNIAANQAAGIFTPIVRISLMNGEDIVQCVYAKIFLYEEETPQPEAWTKEISFNLPDDYEGNLTAAGIIYDGASQYTLTVKASAMNDRLYSDPDYHGNFYFSDVTESGDVGQVSLTSTNPQCLQWVIDGDTVLEKAKKYGGNIQNEVVFFDSGNNTYKVTLKARIDALKTVYNLTPSDWYMSYYWNEGYTLSFMNPPIPEGNYDPEKCVYQLNIGNLFRTSNGILAPDGITDVAFYFVPESGATYGSGLCRVSDVYFRCNPNDKNILEARFWGGTDYTPVAVLNNAGDTQSGRYTLSLYNNEMSQKLVNSGGWRIHLGAQGKKYDTTFNLNFNGSSTFDIFVYRPIELLPGSGSFKQDVDPGEKGSYLFIEDAVTVTDWRGRSFSDADNWTYWLFFGTELGNPCRFSVGEITMKLNGTETALPSYIKVQFYERSTAVMSGGYSISSSDNEYGVLTFKNTGGVSGNFEICVVVNLEHRWGTIKEKISIPVK